MLSIQAASTLSEADALRLDLTTDAQVILMLSGSDPGGRVGMVTRPQSWPVQVIMPTWTIRLGSRDAQTTTICLTQVGGVESG